MWTYFQDVFESVEFSIVSTWVKMLGEFDFGDWFFPEVHEEEPSYPDATIVLFVIFLVLMGIIVMNLLVGIKKNNKTNNL